MLKQKSKKSLNDQGIQLLEGEMIKVKGNPFINYEPIIKIIHLPLPGDLDATSVIVYSGFNIDTKVSMSKQLIRVANWSRSKDHKELFVVNPRKPHVEIHFFEVSREKFNDYEEQVEQIDAILSREIFNGESGPRLNPIRVFRNYFENGQIEFRKTYFPEKVSQFEECTFQIMSSLKKIISQAPSSKIHYEDLSSIDH